MTEKQKAAIAAKAARMFKKYADEVALNPRNVRKLYDEFARAIRPDYDLERPSRQPMAEYVDHLSTFYGVRLFKIARAA